MEGRQGKISEVWRNLPEEILIKVCEDHLPFSSLCRFRSVSRSWSKPKLRPDSLTGLSICKTIILTDVSTYRIYLFKGQKRLSLLMSGPDMDIVCCINGMLCCIHGYTHQVKFILCNVFRGHGGTWTWLPHPPPAPNRTLFFAGMSRVPSETQPPPRIGVDPNLDDYIFLAAMGSDDYRPINLLLQVYSRGAWSCSVFDFPNGECIMFGRCRVLRGSLFYFFMMRLDRSSARLCCIDLLTPDRQCKAVCELEAGGMRDWDASSFEHPKLAVCSGKLLMVYQHALKQFGTSTLKIEVFDDEKGTWTGVSTLPEELRRSKSFHPDVISSGGDELIVFDIQFGVCYAVGYNLATGAWYPLADLEQCHAIPMHVSY